MAITWSNQMSIDHGLIDEDHKTLIELADTVNSVKPGPAMQGEIAIILDRLYGYTQIHCQREEQLQAAAHFVNARAHGEYHESLMRDLDAIRSECKSKMTNRQFTAFQRRVSDLLDEWLVDHIIRSDALMKPFIAELQPYTVGEISLAEAVRLSEAECWMPRNANGVVR
jgi:hemerythrin